MKKSNLFKMTVFLLSCSISFFLISCEQDPTKGILKVTCVEKYGGSYVEGITVELYSSNSNYLLQKSTTNSSGYVWINDLTPGSYWVKTNDVDLWTQVSGTGMVEADNVTTITLEVNSK